MSGRPGGPTDPRPARPPRSAGRSAGRSAADAWAEDARGESPDARARLRDRAEAARARAERVRDHLERRRPANRWVDAAFVAIDRDVRTGGGVLAAALAFRIFTFLIPFTFVVVTGLPFLGDATQADPRDLADSFGMSGLVARTIGHADDLSLWHRTWLLVVGCVALVLAARGLVRVLRITHGLAWNVPVPRLRRPFSAAGLLIGTMVAVLAVGLLTEWAQQALGWFGFIPFLGYGLALVATWTLIQYHLPHAGVPWTRLVPGAALVAGGIEVLQIATTYWFTRSIENQSETYGALGAALAILVWAYIVGRIAVTGAMFNVALEEQRHRDRSERSGAAERPV
jgi:uncharacterized BrkB/YihY/UPF0761 family membrane protein